MKRLYFLLLMVCVFSISCDNEEETINSDLNIRTLLCEYETNPLGIDNPNPRLTWKVTDSGRNGYQTAYQILVSASPEDLEQGKAEIWNSGRMRSGQSVNVIYGGRQLKSGQRYYWKVRIWDENEQVSEFSNPAWWEMGLLEPEDWKGQWISAPRVFDWSKRDQLRKQIPKDAPPMHEEPAPIFRKSINIQKEISAARIYFCGLGYSELYIDGEKIGGAVLDPAFTDYTQTVLYRTFDISDRLTPGDHTIAVLLGNGWYNMFTRAVWSFDKSPWIADPAVRFQMTIQYQDGSEQLVLSDSSWKCSAGPVIFNAVRQGETYDARLEKEGWMDPGYDDSEWFDVRKVRGPEGKMESQSMPPIQIREKIPPVSIQLTPENTWVCDFGQNMAGFAEISVVVDAGTELKMKYGEKLNPDGTVDQSNIDGLVAENPFQTDTYVAKGNEKETWHPRFSYHGFRYVEVTGYPGEFRPENIKACVVHTAFEKRGNIETSSDLINQIQKNTEWSFVNNYHGYPTDCPHREKNGWTGDAQLASEMALYNYSVETAYDKWVGDIIDVQLKSGMVPAIVPTGGWGYYWGNGPAWDYALLVIPWNTYVYSGDKQMLEKYYPYMEKYMTFLTSTAENNIVSWGLGDWVPIRTTTPPELITSAYYYQDALLMSKIASILGEQKEGVYYRELADRIKSSWQKQFIKPSEGIIGNGSQTSIGCALYFSLLDSLDNKRYSEKLWQNISGSDLNLDFGVLGSKFVPNALAMNGHIDEAFDMIHTTEFPGWGNWVSHGATTLWEDWKGEASRNHVFFGDVSAWFYKYLAGIQVDENNPGYRHFFIRPFFPEGLEWVRAEIKSPKGPVKSDWVKKGNFIELNITIPFNSSATIELLDQKEVKVFDSLNGEPIPIPEIEARNSGFVFNLKSGSYRMEVYD